MAKFNIYDQITANIVAQLESGIIPWQKPWDAVNGGARSYTSGKPYSLLNQWLVGEEGFFLTFNQIQELGGKIKAGAKSKMVVFWKMLEQVEVLHDEEGNEYENIKKFPILKSYRVFNINDTEGIKNKREQEQKPVTINPIDSAEKIIADYFDRESVMLNIKYSNEAFYCPSTDEVVVPKREQYKNIAEFYSTTFHEMIHSTGHDSRLKRIAVGEYAAFGSEKYSKEELVAEIGAAFLVNKAGIDNKEAFQNSVAYIQSWAKRLKEDNKLIVSAAAKAETAAKFVLGEVAAAK